MIKNYRKKPVVIEAMRLDTHNVREVAQWCGGTPFGDAVTIHTLEGDMLAQCGDYIIRGVQGEFYPCKPDIFEETYEEVGGQA